LSEDDRRSSGGREIVRRGDYSFIRDTGREMRENCANAKEQFYWDTILEKAFSELI
jgi:hypothetical protein